MGYVFWMSCITWVRRFLRYIRYTGYTGYTRMSRTCVCESTRWSDGKEEEEWGRGSGGGKRRDQKGARGVIATSFAGPGIATFEMHGGFR